MIILGKTDNEKIIEIILDSYPHTSIMKKQREQDVKNVRLWKKFRNNVLKLYDISFTEYTTFCKKLKKLFNDKF